MDDNKIFVGNLSTTTNEEQLLSYFCQFGDIDNVSLIINNNTGQSKGYAFVSFKNEQSALSSLSASGQLLDGATITISAAKQKKRGRR